MTWDNTNLFADDKPADLAFRKEVREWMEKNVPQKIYSIETEPVFTCQAGDRRLVPYGGHMRKVK